MILGLSGYARVGKDSAAKILVEEYGFKRVAFADKLREVLYATNPLVAVDIDYDEHSGIEAIPMRVKDVIRLHGWDGYKETTYGTEIRELLQRLATDAGRNTLWDSIWVDAALDGYTEHSRWVISDCRFENEFDAIKSRGGEILRIVRHGVGPANSHISETSLDHAEFDHIIENNGSLEELRGSVVRFANENNL